MRRLPGWLFDLVFGVIVAAWITSQIAALIEPGYDVPESVSAPFMLLAGWAFYSRHSGGNGNGGD